MEDYKASYMDEEFAKERMALKDANNDGRITFDEYYEQRKKVVKTYWVDEKLSQLEDYEREKCALP